MKYFKKIIKVQLTFILLLGLILSAIPMTLVTKANSLGSITIHSYDRTGTIPGSIADSINNGHEITNEIIIESLGNPISGTEFKVTQITNMTGDSNYDFAFSTITVAQARAIVEANIPFYESDVLYTEILQTGIDGSVSFENLELGVYLVEQMPTSLIASTVAPFLAYIPLTYSYTNTQNEVIQDVLYDIHVYPKNELLYINKLIEGGNDNGLTSVKNVNDFANWEISTTIPADISTMDLEGGTGYFFIEDILDSRLDFEGLEVVFIDRDNNIVSTSLVNDINHTMINNPDGSSTIRIDFNNNVARDNLIQAQSSDYLLKITINTRINSIASLDLSIPIKDDASLYYLNSGGNPSNPNNPIKTEIAPEIKLLGLAVHKVDIDNPEIVLQGARFELYWSAIYSEDANDYQHVATSTTDDQGIIYWSYDGLIFNDNITTNTAIGNGYYFVKEVLSPDGYQLLNTISQIVNIDGTRGVTIPLTNTKLSGSFLLPTTGGSGIWFYTITGLVLISSAIILYVVVRKRNKEENAAIEDSVVVITEDE